MTRKARGTPTVKLERYPHRDAMARLRQAYQLLIEAHQGTEDNAEIQPDEEHRLQEVK